MNQQDILLRQTFHEEMITLYKRTAKELKYKSPRLLEMINKYGGYEAAIKILPTDAHTFDFALMWENQRLDLSIEALVTKACYKELFPQEIITFCQRRLDEYNYAPNKIVEPVEEKILPYTEEENIEPIQVPTSEEIPEPRQCEDYMVKAITTSQWVELFMKTSIFTAKNQDMILKIYETGSLNISAQTLAGLEGYSAKYPFYEVILSLCKRIKATLKIEVPKNDAGKLLWWQFLFTGYYENNQNFIFNLRPELDKALTTLMEEGRIPKIERQIHPEYETLELVQVVPPEPEVVEEVVEESQEEVVVPVSPKKSIVSSNGEIPSLDDFIDFLISDTPAPRQKVETPSPSASTPLTPTMAFHSESLEQEPSSNNVLEIEETPVKQTEAPVHQEVASTPQEPSSPSLEQNEEMLLEEKKKACLDDYGAVCELCGFDFGYTYGIQFENLIKVHLLKPELTVEQINPQEDLIPICHNCEAVLKAHNPHFSVDEVKAFIKKAKDAE